MLTEQGIRRYIKSDIDIIFFDASPSTNLEAKSIAATAREGTVIFASGSCPAGAAWAGASKAPRGAYT